MDDKTTLMNGKLDVEIYGEHFVCKLKKLLYGLQQSGIAWYKCIHIFNVNKGFPKSHSDHSLYILQSCHYIVIVIIYINNLIILASNVDMINELKYSLERKFEISDLGELHFFLGALFKRDMRSRIITMH